MKWNKPEQVETAEKMSVTSQPRNPENRSYKFNTYTGVIDFDYHGIRTTAKPARKMWNVPVTDFAKNTHNPIRAIVEGLKIEPNPEKQLIALSIGKSMWASLQNWLKANIVQHKRQTVCSPDTFQLHVCLQSSFDFACHPNYESRTVSRQVQGKFLSAFA